MPDPATARLGHETRDISARGVAWFAVALVVSAVIVHLAIAGLYKLFEHSHPSPDAPSRIALHPHMIAPAPQLQTATTMDLQKFRSAEEAKLNSYGWVDKSAGVVRIPIDRAMDLIAQRGLPVRSGPDDKRTSGKTAIQMQEEKAGATKP